MRLNIPLLFALVIPALAVNPAAIYDGGFNSTEGTTNSTIELRIGNGGAGQSGLIKGRADRGVSFD